jgi:hypothetical protein
VKQGFVPVRLPVFQGSRPAAVFSFEAQKINENESSN